MKLIALSAAALMLTAGMATAAPGKTYGHKSFGKVHKLYSVKRKKAGRLTWFERIKIARSRSRLAKMRARARAEGRITRREAVRIRVAQRRHRALVRKERRD